MSSGSLEQLVADGIIDAVISRLKSGKEADIYLVQHRGEIVAAKLYKDRSQRSFQNRAAYQEGRVHRSSRTQRAIDKGSRFGQAAAEEAWKSTEADTLAKLHPAGVRVPQPVMFYEGVLLMEVVIDAEGHPAPRLIDATVPKERAAELYADLRTQAVRMLTCDLIHGDLSPYNVLLAWNGPTIIDFPQVIGAAHNRQAFAFFERDLRALHRYFASLDPALHAHAGDARQIWRAYERRELTADFVPSPGSAAAPREERRPHERGGHAQRGQHKARGHQGGGGRPQRGADPGSQGKPRDHGQPRVEHTPAQGGERHPAQHRGEGRHHAPGQHRGEQRPPGGERQHGQHRGEQRPPGGEQQHGQHRGEQRPPGGGGHHGQHRGEQHGGQRASKPGQPEHGGQQRHGAADPRGHADRHQHRGQGGEQQRGGNRDRRPPRGGGGPVVTYVSAPPSGKRT